MSRLDHLLEDLQADLFGEAKKSGAPGTVKVFNMVLTSKLTQYDMRLSKGEAKRGRVNIYRLGHFLGAANKVAQDTKSFENSDSKEDLEKLKASINKHFTDFPPRRAVLKQIDQFIATGKAPSLVRK